MCCGASMGKKLGMEKAPQKIKSEIAYQEFIQAVTEIKRKVDKGLMEPKYIPMWSSFVNGKWKNYLPDNDTKKESPFEAF
jgi:hypothetical protein